MLEPIEKEDDGTLTDLNFLVETLLSELVELVDFKTVIDAIDKIEGLPKLRQSLTPRPTAR